MPPKFHSLYDYSFGFYSPGICPTGYSKGCDFPVDRARTDDLGEVYYGGAVLKGETVRVCCPTGYTCLLNDPYSYSKCVHTTDDSELAFALQVRWQESDLSILATDPTVPGSTYSAPATATATPATIKSTAKSGSNIDATATPTPSSSSSTTVTQNENPGSTTQGGLSSGSTIAIALGVGGMVFAFAISALIFFIWRQRRKRRENEGTRIESTVFGDGDSKSSPDGFAPDRKAELDSRALASSTALSEAQAERDAVEMPPLHIAATEMEVPHFVAELPGSMPAGHDNAKNGEQTSAKNGPRSPLPTAETSQRESGALGNPGNWKRRSVARGQSQLRPSSRSSTSTSTTTTTTTTEDRQEHST